MVFSYPVLVTVRVPMQILADEPVGSLVPFIEAGEDIKAVVAKSLEIDPEGVIYQAIEAYGDRRVVVEVTKIFPTRRVMKEGMVQLLVGDLLDALEPIVGQIYRDEIPLDVFAETFKDDIDARSHANTTVYSAIKR